MTYTIEEACIKIQKLVEDFCVHEAILEKAVEEKIKKPTFSFNHEKTFFLSLNLLHAVV